MSETSEATTGSNSEGNSMSPPEAEQTDTSDAENDGARKLPQSTGNQDEAERSVLDMDPSGISSETSREHGHGSQPRASHLRSSSSHVDEVTRVTSSLDGNETANNDGTSLNATRMNPKDESESDGNSVSSSQSQNQKSENEEAADNDSVTNLLREIQSVESTAASQKDPEGRYNSSRKFSDVDLKIDQREEEHNIMSPLEPPPVETLDAEMAEASEEEEKKTEGAPISPVTSLESTAVDALKQEPDTAAPESLLDQHEAAVQLELRTSPPINRIAPYAAESDLSVMSSQAPDPVATSGVIPTSYHQHMDPRIDPRNSLTMPALPQLLPAHQMVHGLPTHIAQGAPAPGPVGNGYHQALNIMAQMQHAPPPSSVLMPNSSIGGKRKIYLRLIEDITVPTTKERRSSFLSFRLKKVHQTAIAENEVHTDADRGRVTVSWYEGTTSLELQEHVRNTVSRKLSLSGTTKLSDMRVLDESSDPPEEIVLSTYIPDGSRLLLRFSTRDAGGDVTPMRRPSYTGGAPDSPSAAPSPHASALDLHGLGLNPNQLALLGARLDAVQMPLSDDSQSAKEKFYLKKRKSSQSEKNESKSKDSKSPTRSARKSADSKGSPDGKDKGDSDDENSKASSTMEMHSLHPEDHIQKSLRQITELLIAERTGKGKAVPYVPRQEKRQVIFVLANYFVLFLSLIAISAEIQARAPGWNASVEQYLKNVRSCSQDQDALFECVSNGDLAGLMASVVLWFSRSAATKRIFLFGFGSPQKLWTVVYESLVTAICWGISYMFIRRGMNPDTRRNFLQKYWKDAIYGSLAGFNAAFMKHVLKNLIPQEAIEDALQERQLKILSWLPSFS